VRMEAPLEVKNFGPITDATLKLRKVTVLIGPTGSGKSTLAKLVALFDAEPNFQLYKSYGAHEDRSLLTDYGLNECYNLNRIPEVSHILSGAVKSICNCLGTDRL
jgi:predicted ATPase